jgi:hypothetical protein
MVVVFVSYIFDFDLVIASLPASRALLYQLEDTDENPNLLLGPNENTNLLTFVGMAGIALTVSVSDLFRRAPAYLIFTTQDHNFNIKLICTSCTSARS